MRTSANSLFRCIPLALLAAIVVGGCAARSVPNSSATYRVIGGETYAPAPLATSEYVREAASLVLPVGDHWPATPVRLSEAGGADWYGIGYGRQAADRYWFCRWSSLAVTTRSNEVRNRAVSRLMAIFKLYYCVHALDAPSRPPLVAEMHQAQRGDLSALRTDVRQNC
ncbi:MAG: hypothetical protein WBQ18_12820 [Solirubrobacteraceae bacterium]